MRDGEKKIRLKLFLVCVLEILKIIYIYEIKITHKRIEKNLFFFLHDSERVLFVHFNSF